MQKTGIYIEHPEASIRQRQEQFLAGCLQDQRAYHTLLFNHGNASVRYYSRAKGGDEKTWEIWLEGLDKNVREGFKQMGYEKGKTALPFLRFVNELNDLGYDEYIRKLLRPEDWEQLSSLSKR